jgi:N-methylhydantoinase A/oxoprolinase/acetone carboxylase beta subunit
VVTLEVRASLPGERPRVRSERASDAAIPPARVRDASRWLSVPVRSRASLPRAFAARGPMLVVEEGATLWIPPRWRARLHGSGTVVVTR